MNYPLSGADIKRFLKKTKIIAYKDIQKYRNAYDLIYPHNEVVIFYKTASGEGSQGHWTSLLKNSHGWEMFDSYAIFLDEELNFPVQPEPGEDEEMFKIRHGQDARYLTKLLAEVREPVSYNHFRFQAFELPDGTRPQSCGRWVILRLLNKEKSLEEFKEGVDLLSDYYSSPDEMVTTLIRAHGEQ